jgi:anti-sigma regulatory factor (Ser/Thr protein kinase)
VTKAEPQTLPHTLEAPGLARRYVAARSAAWPADLVDLTVLLTSELVTNAVVHGRGPIQLLLLDDGDRLRVEVGDGEPRLPDGPGKPADLDISGRGLMILDRLADRWGSHSRRTPPGKVVWFEVRHRLPALATAGFPVIHVG